MKHGLLLINLGTPSTPTPRGVRKFLRTFLSDPRVISLPTIFRWALVNLIILPLRTQRTIKAYQKIWTSEGSPLQVNSLQLLEKLRKTTTQHPIALGMCYGDPSLTDALEELHACETITIFPLYPQYSSAATGAALEKILKLLAKKATIPHLNIISNFYLQPQYIKTQANLIRPLMNEEIDHIIFSYHGVPEKQLECQNICPQKCLFTDQSLANCYRAQCFYTTELLKKELGLATDFTSTTFQSRLGKTPWIKPYTELRLQELREAGVKNLLICCPSFVADCLETLEEIGMRLNHYWHTLGGNSLQLTPCLNGSDAWAEAILHIAGLNLAS
jgi:ferrochelatase